MPNSSKYQQVASAILQQIVSGSDAGAALPSERILAARYQVNRRTLHKALLYLQAQKAVQICPGGGFVCGNGPDKPVRIGILRTAGFWAWPELETALDTASSALSIEYVLLSASLAQCPPDLALILAIGAVPDEVYLRARKIAPVAAILPERTLPWPELAIMDVNYFDWGYRAARFLLARQKRRIALVLPEQAPPELTAGFVAAFKELGKNCDRSLWRIGGADSIENGLLQLNSLLELSNFDALAVAGMPLSVGVMVGLNESVLEVPVIAGNVDPRFRFDQYPLHELTFPLAQLARKLPQWLRRRLEHPRRKVPKILLPAVFN